MAEVKPFRGIHYDVKRVGDLTRVVAPPYDVISPEEQEALHRRHPKNITWVDFGMAKEGDGPGENKYTRAAALFREWLAEGTLVRDSAAGPLLLRAGVHDPREEDLRAEGVPRRPEAVGVRGRGGVPPRADAFQAEGGPARPDARDRRPHEPDLRALLRPEGRGPFEPALRDGRGARHGRRRRPGRKAPGLDGVAAQGAPGGGGRDEGEGGLHRRRAPPIRDGAGVSRRDAEEARREPRRRVRARAHVPVQHGRRGDRHPADAPRHPLRARLLGGRVPREGARPPSGREPGRLAGGRDASGGGGGEEGEGDRLERGREPVPRGHLPGPARFLRQVPLEVPAAAPTARRRSAPRVPPGAAPRDLPRGGDGGAVREVLQGAGQGGEGSLGRRDPGRLLHECGDDPRVPRRLPLRARPPAEVDLLLPEDRDGAAHLPRGGRTTAYRGRTR